MDLKRELVENCFVNCNVVYKDIGLVIHNDNIFGIYRHFSLI